MTLVDVLIVVALLALLVVVFLVVPDRNARHRTEKVICLNNLRQIELAFKTWTADQSDRFVMQMPMKEGGTMELITNGLTYLHFQAMSNELGTPKPLVCPADKGKTVAESFSAGKFDNANVSYFIGVDASDTYPETILAGDRNLSLDGTAVEPGLLPIKTNMLLAWTEDLHAGWGNIGLADGSMRLVNSVQLRKAVQDSGYRTNRLLVP